MSEVEIRIGGRPFTVACQPGEEAFLQAAARMLDAEASTLVDSLGRMPETQMLLMSGLMLADKTAGIEDKLVAIEAGTASKPGAAPGLAGKLEALAARAEKLAEALEAKTAG
ncbi:MAG: cell division protein ZapA [Paracoccaceae bacterium]|nr:cell division protein ZapA [Paracoccaceae bacterium]